MGIQSEAEQAAWLPPEALTPVEWAERNRVLLPPSAEVGPLRFNRMPYWRDVVNAVADPNILTIVCLKGVQNGFSEAIRSILGYWIDCDPGPVQLILPNEDAAREALGEKIKTLVEQTPAISRHLSPDPDEVTKSVITFDAMKIHTGWAGSPQSLASREIRYLLLDEIDKYVGKAYESDPISLASRRTESYKHRKKIILGSTPTLRNRPTWKEFERCEDQRTFHVPCPHCGKYQRLVFTGIKWPEMADVKSNATKASRIQVDSLAYYQCAHCKQAIKEQQKAQMVNRGVWVSGKLQADGQWIASQSVNADGTLDSPRPRTTRVGFWINSLYSPFKSFSDIAAEYLQSIGDVKKMQDFKNNICGEPFEEQFSSTKASDISGLKKLAPQAKMFPEWAYYLSLCVDVRQEGRECHYTVRAWGVGYKSQLVEHGIAKLGELLDVLNRTYPIEGHPDAEPKGIDLMLIDAGYLPGKVYELASLDARIYPIMGARQKPQKTISTKVGSAELGVEVRHLDTTYFKNQWLARRTAGLWLVNNAIDDDYARQMASEHKIKKGDELVWEPISSGAANHWFDCEASYQQAAADLMRVNLLTDVEEEGTDGETAEEVFTGMF